MRKIYLKISVNVLVNADDNVSMKDIEESIEIETKNSNSNFDIEDSSIENIEVVDSK